MPLPERAGKLYGYRAWKVLGGKLYSLGGFDPRPWPVDRPRAAICWRNFTPWAHGPAPAWGHKCGIYALKDLPTFSYSPQGMRSVWGLVELSGHIVEHEIAYRAQFARPVAIAYSEGVEEAAVRYGLLMLERLEDWKT